VREDPSPILDYGRPLRPEEPIIDAMLHYALPVLVGTILAFLVPYALAVVAWFLLGHWPVPSLDDPKGVIGASLAEIGVLCWVVHLAGAVCGFGLASLALVINVLRGSSDRLRPAFLSLTNLALLIAGLGLARWSRVMEWLLD
jgi:hypothetical protein